MSDEKKRSVEAVQVEYNQLCAAAGEKAYRIRQLEFDITQIHARFNQLNEEAKELLQKAPETSPVPDTDLSEVPNASDAV